MQYCLNFENIKNKKLREIKIILNNPDNYIRLSELKVKDLVFLKDNPIKTGNGVYVFYNGKNIVYVGKCSGRSFIERIPSHFDIREKAWFNTLLKKLKTQKENKKCSLVKVAKNVFNQYSVQIINFKNPKNNKDYCIKLESCLRGILIPELNSKKKYNYDEKISLSNQLKIQK